MSQVQAGATGFDAVDRLAILNVVNSYAFFVDERPLDDFFALFTDDARMEIWSGETLVAQGAEIRGVMRAQTEGVRQRNIQRRHILNSIRVDGQEAAKAQVQSYFQLYSVAKGECVLEALGWYDLSLVKVGGVWKISGWVAHGDWMVATER